jgi:hypothetical protein
MMVADRTDIADCRFQNSGNVCLFAYYIYLA